MKPRPPLPPGPYLIVGLGRSGVAAALALRERGAEVLASDARPVGPEVQGRLSQAGVEVQADASVDALAARARTLVKSPGVPQDAAPVAAARRRGITVLGELELGWRLLENEFVAVTGTNGKTTSTEWIGHIHRTAGAPVAVAGNVGTAVCSLVGHLDRAATVVCEASSFQLEDTEAFAPEAAILLNLSSDHLDRHGDYESYVAAKLRIFANQGNEDVAVAPQELHALDLGGCARRVTFGQGAGAELSLHAGHLWWDEQPVLHAREVSLRGEHNLRNAMASAAVCLARGVDPEAVREGLRTFPGVPHRLELVSVRAGVQFVNDSKATNVASAIVALRTFPHRVHLLAGGRGKGQDFSALAGPVAERCAAVYLIGESAGELEAALRGTGVPIHRAGSLEHAVAAARAAARPGEVVLLSPACASYDQFEDFEARGERFRTLAQA